MNCTWIYSSNNNSNWSKDQAVHLLILIRFSFPSKTPRKLLACWAAAMHGKATISLQPLLCLTLHLHLVKYGPMPTRATRAAAAALVWINITVSSVGLVASLCFLPVVTVDSFQVFKVIHWKKAITLMWIHSSSSSQAMSCLRHRPIK